MSARLVSGAGLDRILAPIHRWIWSDPGRRVGKLRRFGETEIDGGRDILRAAELTPDPLLRRLYLLHAIDEQRHGVLFRKRAAMLTRELPADSRPTADGVWLADAGHGLDDLEVGQETDDRLLAFLHVAEKAAARRFTVYRDVMEHDAATRAVFEDILHDEMFHMNYTLTQLVRVSPQRHRRHLWRARFSRLWKAYLRVAVAVAGVIGSVVLTIQYFLVLPPFAYVARRAARRARRGWIAIAPERNDSITSQY
ncbi:MAG: ferritin-like domain-containing protein [Thermoanaerobaculia bacterium]